MRGPFRESEPVGAPPHRAELWFSAVPCCPLPARGARGAEPGAGAAQPGAAGGYTLWASARRTSFLRSLGSRSFLRRRIDLGVTSTSSSSSI